MGRLTGPLASAPAPPARPSGPRPLWARLLPHVLALAATATLLPVTIVFLATEYRLPGTFAALLGTAQTAPLLFAAAHPLRVWRIVFPAGVLTALLLLGTPGVTEAGLPWPWPPMTIVGYLLLCLALSLRERRSVLIAVWVATALAGLALAVPAPGTDLAPTLVMVSVSAAVLFLGGSIQERSEAQRRLAEQETISEAERARRTVLEERARIARELHDVVAHHMSVITVQADSAPYRINGLPEEAHREFSAIAGTARQSLSEMRRLLGVLRSEESGGERAPQPGLEDLDTLVESAVRAGIEVRLTRTGQPSRLPQAIGLHAYRIVQEALANVVRHAPGSTARISVTGENGLLRLEVLNDRPEGPGAPLETSGTGHGLVGMRERARLAGGTLETGPVPGGGFKVAATLPLDPAPSGKDPAAT
ncbi:histidine kinase [Streptomyces sodiiphilus]|uniref:histidine kinase n=1 Tax=Streptomyces sodiiphilus TaxID=226217 RepID=A0ABN2NTF4_9ACTN